MRTIEDYARAIVADPRDMDLRAVFADFLEDRDDPRAELARIPFKLSQAQPYESEWRNLQALDGRLTRKHGPFLAAPKGLKPTLMRGGFLEGAEVSLARLLREPELLREAPLLQLQIRGHMKPKQATSLAKLWPRLPKIDRIHWLLQTTESLQIRLFTELNLEHLQALRIHSTPVTRVVLNAITQLSSLRRLRELVYTGVMDTAAMAAIDSSPCCLR